MRSVFLILVVFAAGCVSTRTVEEMPPVEGSSPKADVSSPGAHAWGSRYGKDDPRRHEEYLSIMPEKRETLDTSVYTIEPALVARREFRVSGIVIRPGVYPCEEGMTVLRAIATAGGYTGRAYTKVILFRNPRRFKPEPGDNDLDRRGMMIYEIDVEAMERGMSRPVMVFPGDRIVVTNDLFVDTTEGAEE